MNYLSGKDKYMFFEKIVLPILLTISGFILLTHFLEYIFTNYSLDTHGDYLVYIVGGLFLYRLIRYRRLF